MKKKDILLEIRELNQKIYIKVKELEQGVNEGGQTVSLINELFRIFHTLKGLSSMGGNSELAKFMHKCENTLDNARNGKIEIGEKLINALKKVNIAIDTLSDQHTGEKQKREIVKSVIKGFSSVPKSKTLIQTDNYTKLKAKLPPEVKSSLSDYEENRIKINLSSGNKIFLIKTNIDFETMETALKKLTDALSEYGEVIASVPGDYNEKEKKIAFFIIFSGENKPDNLGLIEKSIEEITPLTENTPKQSADKRKTEEIHPVLKIKAEKIDKLLGDMDEIENAKQQLIQKAKEIMFPPEFEKISFYINHLENKISALHKNIIDLRLVSLWPLFRIIENTVYQLAEKRGKKIKTVIKGANTKIDKPIIDKLIEPILHIIRNAVDHGIESPKERIKKGKSPEGTIIISSYQSENSVFIEIKDDGKGIDKEKVIKKAKKTGFLDYYEKITDELIYQFLFMPGFSTLDKPNELSGRGVGLDIVKETITSFGGDIYVFSEKDKGTIFTLKLPLSSAIIPLFFTKVENFTVCVPEFSVENIEWFKPENVTYLNNRTYYKYGDNSIPLINLSVLLNKINLDSKMAAVLIINFANSLIAIQVDEIVDHAEKTVIPFKGKLKKLPLFSSICRHKQEIGYIIDLNNLIDFTRKKYESKLKLRSIGF